MNIGKKRTTNILKMAIMNCTILFLLIVMMKSLHMCGWNMRSLAPAAGYLKYLAQNNDILVCSEHRLFNYQLYRIKDYLPGYEVYAKASADLEDSMSCTRSGHCGLFIAWSEEISSQVRRIDVDSDRICTIQICNAYSDDKSNLYIIGVYLPQQACQISDFQTHLNKLEVLIERCSCDGEVVILGDFNCNFGSEVGTRFSGTTTPNARKLINLCNRKGLLIVYKDVMCSGPKYSFFVEGVGESYVDHVIVSSTLKGAVEKCEILEDSTENTSDHLPITMTLSLDKLPVRSPRVATRHIKWHKLSDNDIKVRYTDPTEALLSNAFPFIDEDTVLMEYALAEVVTVLSEILDEVSLPLYTKVNKSVKPYWTRDLTAVSKKAKQIWHDWCNEGRPRS